MWRTILSAAILACMARCTPDQSAHPQPPASEASKAASLSSQDRDFLERAAEGNNGEAAMGRVAQKNGASAAVIEYGRMMVADHGAAQTRLAAIARQKSIALPTSLGEHQAGFDRIVDLKGEDFDTEFMKVMVEDHHNAVLLYQSEASGGVDPPIVAYARETLPKIRAHLEHAKALAPK